MSLNDWRILFFSIGIILLAIILLTMTLSFFPLNEENFTSMAILGTNSKGVPLEGYYFPGDNFTIHLGKVMNWKIVLYNHRDSAQYVLVKVKILNSTMTAPNNVLGTPSSAPTIYETTKLLAKNSTLPIPFTWSFIYASITGNTARSILYKQILRQ